MAQEDPGVLRQRARTLLAPLRIRQFRRLWIADMVSLLGDWAARLALAVLVLERTGSPAWSAAVTAVSLAGFVGIGQVLATLADRHGRVSVMLVADVARAALFAAMLLPLPVGALLVLAFLAGLATPPFEAARSAAIPDLVPEETYGDALALAGISVQSSLVLGYAIGGLLLGVVEPEVALAINATSFLVSAALILELRHTRAAEPAGVPASVGRSLGDGYAAILHDRLIRRALVIVAVLGALGTVGEALVVSYGVEVGMPDGTLGLLAAAVPVGTLLGVAAIAAGGRDHSRLLRTAALCGAVTSAAAAPLFWLEASGPFAFVAFAIAGGMFAVSIPTNTVIGLRLSRDTRASAMGIAVGVLMGSQALGAALGGVAASSIGTPQAITVALVGACACSLWWAATTPQEAKHLRRPAREPDSVPEESVVDLVSFEADRPSAGVRVNRSGGPSVSTGMDPCPLVRFARPLSVTLLVATLALGVAACGDDEEPAATGDQSGTTEDTGSGDTTGGYDYGATGGGTTTDSGSADAPKGTIVAVDYSLSDITVGPGEPIVMENEGSFTHTATADEGEFDLGEVDPGETSPPGTAPDEPGSYAFHCEIHSGMTATLTVEG